MSHRVYLRNAWRNYHEVVSSLGLSPENEIKLINLLCAQDERAIGVARNAASTTEPSQLKAWAASVDLAHSSVSAEIRELLGDNAFEILEKAKQFQYHELAVDNTFAVDLALDGVPLTPDQRTAMVHIYDDTVTAPRKTIPDERGQLPVDPQTGFSETDEMLLDHASTVLSPAQMQSLRKSLIDTQNEMKALYANHAPRAP